MASRRCDHCGATVAADEQFCPNCGSYLDPLNDEPNPRNRDNVISVHSDGNYEEFELGAAPPSSESGAGGGTGEVVCPSCGAPNPANNRHCQECGARISQGPLPTAPRPAVQATAGVRAALAISALLFGVIIVALLFNIFNGDPTTGTTLAASTTTSTTVAELAPIDILGAECNQEGIGSFVCENLINSSDSEYQFDYEAVPEGEAITIRLTFNQPMVVQRIDWVNLEDATRLKRNYRARGLSITAQDSIQPFVYELEDLAGSQPIAYVAMDTNWIEITIESDYPAEVVEEEVFTEMAIQEIRVIGRPGTVTNGTTPTTVPGTAPTTTAPAGTTTVPASTTAAG